MLFSTLFLPPEEKFYHPVEGLRFNEEEADVLTMPFDYGRGIQQGYVV